ncbi:MAG: deoxyribonuclease IV, partial [Halobacteriota archaeon]
MNAGAHVSVAGGVDKAIDRQTEIGGSCGQIFAGSPRTWSVAEYTEAEAEAFRSAREDSGQGPYLVHSTYLVNLATPKDELWEKSKTCLQKELDAADSLGVEYVVFHPGAHTGSGRENGINRVAEAVDDLQVPGDVTLLYENTAGKGTTLGKEFSELAGMLDATSESSVAACVDTCHAHAAGYDLRDDDGFTETVEEIDSTVGLDNVPVVHVNDSKDPLGSEKDNHEHLGRGEIGDEGFRNLVESELAERPLVLETPTSDGRSYAENLEHLE